MGRGQGRGVVCVVLLGALAACAPTTEEHGNNATEAQGLSESRQLPEPQFTLSDESTHNKFSSAIPPALKVPSGAVIEVFTQEATGGQLSPDSTPEDLDSVDWDLVHALTGLTRGDAYALASLAGDLKINEVVDVPHVLVSMHMPKAIFR